MLPYHILRDLILPYLTGTDRKPFSRGIQWYRLHIFRIHIKHVIRALLLQRCFTVVLPYRILPSYFGLPYYTLPHGT